MAILPVFCGRDCGGDACPLVADLEGGRVFRIRNNPAAGKFLRGCPKGMALPHFHYSPTRIKTPLRRTGARGSGSFSPISWEEAIVEIHDRIENAIERSGVGTLMSLSSAGSVGSLHSTQSLAQRFLDCLGGSSRLEGNYSSNAAGYVIKKAFGSDYRHSGFDAATIQYSRLIVLWGANILEARLGTELDERLLAASESGIPVITIDPRKTSTTTRTGAKWIPILPGTDIALMYALLYEFNRQGAIDFEYVRTRAVGFDEVMEFVLGTKDGIKKTPKWAAAICRVPAATISELAKKWIESTPVILLPGYSIQRSSYGEEATRLCIALQLASGSFGKKGGSTGSLNNRLPGPRIGSMPPIEDVSHVPVPLLRWADEIIARSQDERAKVRVAYSAGGNYLNQGGDIRKGVRAFESLDFIVSHELFLTPTAMYSDIILPAASPLQKEDVCSPWLGNYLLYKPQILEYEGLERSDYEIFRSLAHAFGKEEAFSCSKSASDWVQSFIESSEIEDVAEFKKNGIYLGREQERVGLREFDENPEVHPLATKSGKIELEDIRYNSAIGNEEEGRNFRLITPKNRLRVHSQGGDHPKSIGKNALYMNSRDFESLGLLEQGRVRLESATGYVIVEAYSTSDLLPGAVSLDEGTWFSSHSMETSGSANFLTSTEGTGESLSCIMHGIPVKISLDFS